MLKILTFFILITFTPFTIFAEEISESKSFLSAKEAYDNSSYSAAADLFNRFIEDFSSSPAVKEAKLYLAQCLFQENKFIQARDILNDLEKSYVPFAIEDKFLFFSGQVYLRANVFKEAEKYFKKLIERHPNSALLTDSKMQLGWTLFQEAKYTEAERIFDSLLKSDSPSIQEEALFRKGESLFFNKNYARALENYSAFIKSFPRSERLARVYFYMAEASFYLEDLPAAAKDYSMALEFSKEDDSVKAVALQGLGWVYIKQNKLNEAEETFLKIAKPQDSDFNRANFLFGMATLYYQSARFDKSIAYFEEMVNKYPEDELFIQALFGKAQCLESLSRMEEAIDAYDRIIQIGLNTGRDTQNFAERSYYNLGHIYFVKGNMRQALSNFQEVAFMPSANKELKRSATVYTADIYQAMSKFDKAIETYSKILKDYPDSLYNDYVLYQLGISQLKSGDTQKAIQSFKDFNQNFGDSEFIDDVNYYLGYAYFKNNDFPEACRQLENFLSAFHDSIYIDKALYLLADSFYNRKLFKEAIDNFEKILKDFSRDKDLAEKAEYAIAYALYEQGEQVEAVKRIKQFIDAHKNSPLTKRLVFWLGQYYYNNSLYELSRKTFDALISDYPQDSGLAEEAKYEIGLSYLAEDKTGEALDIFKGLSQGAGAVLLRMKAALATADLLSGEDKRKEAVEMYNSVVKLASANETAENKDNTGIEFDEFLDYTKGEIQLPKSVVFDSSKSKDNDSAEKLAKVAYIRLGDVYKECSEFDNAVYAYRQAMKFAEHESDAYLQFRIGECLEEKGDLTASVEEYLKVPYFKEEDKFWVVKGLLRCAHIYENKEDWRRAISMYERALNYDTPEAKYAQERIDFIKTQTGRKL